MQSRRVLLSLRHGYVPNPLPITSAQFNSLFLRRVQLKKENAFKNIESLWLDSGTGDEYKATAQYCLYVHWGGSKKHASGNQHSTRSHKTQKVPQFLITETAPEIDLVRDYIRFYNTSISNISIFLLICHWLLPTDVGKPSYYSRLHYYA